MLYEYGEKFIESALKDGMYSPAVKWYLQMLDSLTVHYIQDEHWSYYLQTVSIHRRMYPDGQRLSGYIRFEEFVLALRPVVDGSDCVLQADPGIVVPDENLTNNTENG